MKEINAVNFIDCWEKFTNKKSEDDLEPLKNTASRTINIIGEKKSENVNSPLGEIIKESWGSPLEYRKEDGGVDLSFYVGTNYIQGIKTMNKLGDLLNDDKILKNYPAYYPILVEHENTTELAFQEMIKLTYHNSRLKVLIVYLWEPSSKGDKYEYAISALQENFSKIISQVNNQYKENPETEYLLIAYQIVNNKIENHFSVYDSNGSQK